MVLTLGKQKCFFHDTIPLEHGKKFRFVVRNDLCQISHVFFNRFKIQITVDTHHFFEMKHKIHVNAAKNSIQLFAGQFVEAIGLTQ